MFARIVIQLFGWFIVAIGAIGFGFGEPGSDMVLEGAAFFIGGLLILAVVNAGDRICAELRGPRPSPRPE